MKGCDRSAVFEGGAHPWCRVGSFTNIAMCHQLTWAPNPDSKCCLAPPPISTSARIFASASNFCPPARVQRACATTGHQSPTSITTRAPPNSGANSPSLVGPPRRTIMANPWTLFHPRPKTEQASYRRGVIFQVRTLFWCQVPSYFNYPGISLRHYCRSQFLENLHDIVDQ